MNPLSRAKRILKPMQRFKAAFKDGLPAYAPQIPISADEELIGVYENRLGDIRGSIAVTNLRLLVESEGQWTSVVYSQIVTTEIPEKAAVFEGDVALTVRLATGESEIVPIHGRHGKCFDLFGFSRFLARVRQDANLR
jgi:hypothetical protein